MNDFQQADGWPGWAKTDADKVKYINEYEAREGICLDADKIEKNSGKRGLAKLMLNCIIYTIYFLNYITVRSLFSLLG